MSNLFDWVKDLSSSTPQDSISSSELGPPVSVAEMKQRGWLDEEAAIVAEKAMDDLHLVIKKEGWKLGPQFYQEAIIFKAPDGQVPFALFVSDKKMHIGVCVHGMEDFVAQAELPREFEISFKDGAYKGMALSGPGVNLVRYISVLANSVRHSQCGREAQKA